jgi:hypothetical protein
MESYDGVVATDADKIRMSGLSTNVGGAAACYHLRN